MTADAADPSLPSLPALRSLVCRIADRPIVVVGDVMLDQFTIGRVQRISPEAPVPVVEHIGDEVRLGGAANVAHNIRALGATPRLVGLVGADDAAATLRTALAAAGIGADGLVEDRGRPTTRKVRIVTTRHQQVARVDYESDADAAGEVERALIAAVDRACADAAVVVVSDYLKGAVTPALMRRLAERRAATGLAVLVDPKIPHLATYAGASLITPNHHEAEVATHRRIRCDEDARQAARAFRDLARSTSVMITRGEQGLWLAEGAPAETGGPVHQTPLIIETNLAARAREVADVTGAGDTVIATLAVALASGATLTQAAELANHAAGVAVGKFGPAAVTAAELLDALG
jgi:D-beta-D-heptose 7-phosphate kinase/D-beta-D-heptose 1-phosphate adenosyltransferase